MERSAAFPTHSQTPGRRAARRDHHLNVRARFVDDRVKQWTTGEPHEITGRTFAIRRVLHSNDALLADTAPHWIWRPGPGITVDRTTGHIDALHLPDFDPVVSNAIWFRDYAAYYCGTNMTTKGGRRLRDRCTARRAAVAQKAIGHWPVPNHFIPV